MPDFNPLDLHFVERNICDTQYIPVLPDIPSDADSSVGCSSSKILSSCDTKLAEKKNVNTGGDINTCLVSVYSQSSSSFIVKSNPILDQSADRLDLLDHRRHVSLSMLKYFILLVSSLLITLVCTDYFAWMISIIDCFDYFRFKDNRTGAHLVQLHVELGLGFIQLVDLAYLLMFVVLVYLIQLDPL